MAVPVLPAIEAIEAIEVNGASRANGVTWDDPSEEQLHDLLVGMSLSRRFVVVRRLDVERADQHYMQVSLNDESGV